MKSKRKSVVLGKKLTFGTPRFSGIVKYDDDLVKAIESGEVIEEIIRDDDGSFIGSALHYKADEFECADGGFKCTVKQKGNKFYVQPEGWGKRKGKWKKWG